jgi:hypothetical protein
MNEQPVRGAAVLEVTTTQKGRLQIELFDAQGRRLQGPASRLVEAGVHHVPLEENERLRPGVCFYRVRAVDGERRGRFVIAR